MLNFNFNTFLKDHKTSETRDLYEIRENTKVDNFDLTRKRIENCFVAKKNCENERIFAYLAVEPI